MFTDTHCHLSKEDYDVKEVLENAIAAGINRFIASGSDHKSNMEVMFLIQDFPEVYGVIGIHPHEAKRYKSHDIEYIKKNQTTDKIIGIGEIGLDYYYGKDTKEEQKELFEAQLKIAEEYEVPVVIHSRDATMDTIAILKKYSVKGVIHSFSGSYETAQIYMKMGFKLGVNGVVTFKNSNLGDVIKQIPLEYIVLETDCPYLTPVPYRGKQNEPKHLIEIAEFVANLKDISLTELAEITTKNVRDIFDI